MTIRQVSIAVVDFRFNVWLYDKEGREENYFKSIDLMGCLARWSPNGRRNGCDLFWSTEREVDFSKREMESYSKVNSKSFVNIVKSGFSPLKLCTLLSEISMILFNTDTSF